MSPTSTMIYIVGVSKEDGKSLRDLLEVMGYDAKLIATKGEAVPEFSIKPTDIVITATEGTGQDGIATVEALKGRCPTLPVIVLTDPEQRNLARQAILKGAWDFIFKPVNSGELSKVIVDAVQRIRFFQ